jgi:tripartite-type tricarboxylate transporter receptor subunit TctC
VTYRARSDLAPEVPTAVEAGAPALAAETSIGLYGWRGMPEPARAEFAAQARAVMAERGIVERVRAAGLEPRDAGSPQAFAAELAEQRARYTALAREFGARPAG